MKIWMQLRLLWRMLVLAALFSIEVAVILYAWDLHMDGLARRIGGLLVVLFVGADAHRHVWRYQ